MKILREGKKPVTFEYRGICLNCKTKVQFGMDESVGPDAEGKPTIVCPICKGIISGRQKVKVVEENGVATPETEQAS